MPISLDHEVSTSGHSILNNCLYSKSWLQWSHQVFLRLLRTTEKQNKKPPELPQLWPGYHRVPQTTWKWQELSTGVGAALGASNPHFGNLWSKQLKYWGRTITLQRFQLHQVFCHHQGSIIVPTTAASTSSEQNGTSLSGTFATDKAN